MLQFRTRCSDVIFQFSIADCSFRLSFIRFQFAALISRNPVVKCQFHVYDVIFQLFEFHVSTLIFQISHFNVRRRDCIFQYQSSYVIFQIPDFSFQDEFIIFAFVVFRVLVFILQLHNYDSIC